MTPKILYTARVHTTGNRDGGNSRSDDGLLDIHHALPGTGRGTNPEQLFAAGWSACFDGAMNIAARRLGVVLPPERAIDAEIDLRLDGDAYSLQARLDIHLPGLPADAARAVIEAAHQTCPYSKAIRGNVDVALNLV